MRFPGPDLSRRLASPFGRDGRDTQDDLLLSQESPRKRPETLTSARVTTAEQRPFHVTPHGLAVSHLNPRPSNLDPGLAFVAELSTIRTNLERISPPASQISVLSPES